jgi:UDPglucose--hexose-1-phosphate uridylyltransferase
VTTLHKRTLTKADGRPLILYARQPLLGDVDAPMPGPAIAPNPHRRWHPLRGEWVAYAAHRQERTFLPPPEWDPLAPTADPAHPTELPDAPWDVAVFENRFPALHPNAQAPPPSIVTTAPGTGVCEVIVFTRDASRSLGDLPLWHLELLLRVWADRYVEIGARPEIAYVMPFENRGVEVGATLAHPHGQLYAYPFVPPIPARELAEQRRHLDRHGRGLLEDHVRAERADGQRMIFSGAHVAAFVPACARYPYEVWIAPARAVPHLAALDDAERADLARALRAVLRRYDRLFAKPFPYVMVIHQAPTDGAPHPEAHLHFEFYPPLRDARRLKFLAGTEIGAGAFAVDGLPEARASELRAIVLEDDE